MAETFSPRFGLRIWGASTDGPSRTEFNDIFNQLETKAAIDAQGVLSSRPSAGIQGRYYFATDNSVIYRDNGSAWVVVGSRSVDDISNASAPNTVPFTANGANSQTANLFEAKVNNGSVLASVSASGDIFGANYAGKTAAFTGTATGTVVGAFKSAAGATADVLRVRDNSDAELFRVQPSGVLAGKYIGAGSGTAVVGNSSATTPASMSLFSGAPALEVYANKGGASGAFTDFMYLHHQAADSSVVSRRIGVLMQIGDASGDATKSGAMYIESAVASAANPDLVLARGDTPVARYKSDGTSTFDTAPTINGQVTITPASGSSLALGNTRMGAQGSGNDVYMRPASTGSVYWYAGGNHSATSGDAGTGTRIGQLVKAGSAGKFITGALRSTNTGSTDPSSKDLSAAFGDESALHVGVASAAIQGFNSGAASALGVNTFGGNLTLGGTGSTVAAAGSRFTVGGRGFTIASSAPSSPTTGDVWIQA